MCSAACCDRGRPEAAGVGRERAAAALLDVLPREHAWPQQQGAALPFLLLMLFSGVGRPVSTLPSQSDERAVHIITSLKQDSGTAVTDRRS